MRAFAVAAALVAASSASARSGALLPPGPWMLRADASAHGRHADVHTGGTLPNPRRFAFTIVARRGLRARVFWFVLCNDPRGDVETDTHATVDLRLPAGRVPPMPHRLGGTCTLNVSARLLGTGRLTVKIYGY